MDFSSVDDELVKQLVWSVVIVAFYSLSLKLTSRAISNRANKFKFQQDRSIFVLRAIRTFLFVVLLGVLGIVWRVSFSGLTVYLASFAAIAGVGLFATWSVLSNITCSVILFFFFPIKIGSRVRIVDGDNSVEGDVVSLSLFSIHIQNTEGKDVYYPNNLAIQKGIVHLR